MDAAEDKAGGRAGSGLAAPEMRPSVGRRSAGRMAAAALAALGLHTAALSAVLLAFDLPFGNRGSEVDVVEVSLVSADALRSEAPGTSATASGGISLGDRPGSGADTDAVAGIAAPASAPPETKAEVSPPSERNRPTLPTDSDGDLSPAGPRTSADATPAPARAGDDAAASVAGGASTIAAATAPAEAAATAASEGEVNAYNQRVAVTLSKLKPRGVGETGLARVQFRIDASGAVDDVKLASSTGKSKLDRLATETVARAKFEMPPAGMTSAQLTYAVAFRFR